MKNQTRVSTCRARTITKSIISFFYISSLSSYIYAFIWAWWMWTIWLLQLKSQTWTNSYSWEEAGFFSLISFIQTIKKLINIIQRVLTSPRMRRMNVIPLVSLILHTKTNRQSRVQKHWNTHTHLYKHADASQKKEFWFASNK